jgi:predicted DNA-binding protein with PD1-like motif
MKKFNCDGLGKVVILNLYRGDKLIETIREQIDAAGIKNAVILCAIGSLQKARFHRVLTTDIIAKDEYLDFEGPFELASLQGTIVDGEPHFHMVLSDLQMAYTGHLEEGTVVLYRAEIVLAELLGVKIKKVLDAVGNPIFTEG